MMAYQGSPASIPECVFPAIWRPSVIQGLNSQSRGVVWSLCSGPGKLWAIICASEVFTYPQWVMTKGLADLLGPPAGASCFALDLSPCKLPQCSGNRHYLCGPLPHVLAVFVPLPFWVLILSDLACHMFCLCHWLLGYLNEIFSWDLLCFFAK